MSIISTCCPMFLLFAEIYKPAQLERQVRLIFCCTQPSLESATDLPVWGILKRIVSKGRESRKKEQRMNRDLENPAGWIDWMNRWYLLWTRDNGEENTVIVTQGCEMLVLGEVNIVLCFRQEEIGWIITLKNGTGHLEKLSDCTDRKEKLYRDSEI